MSKVAIIIVNYNGEKYLPALFGSLFKYPAKIATEIIFIDNCSQDNSIRFVKEHYPPVKILAQERNLGFAAGNNVGFKHAMANNFAYVMLLNQDTRVTAGYLDFLVDSLTNNPRAAAVQPKILLYPKTDLLNSLGNVIHFLGFGYAYGHGTPDNPAPNWCWDNGALPATKTLNYCSGAACLLKTSVLKEVGLFDEDLFMYHEDLDLGWRFSLAGYQNIIAEQAIIYHQYEFSRSIKKFYFMERNRFMVMLKNYHWLTLLLILPALLIMELGLFAFSFINGWWREKLKVYAYFFALKNWQQILAKRRAAQGLRKVADREAVAAFSGKIEHQEISSPLIKIIVNPLFNLYWQIVKKLIVW